MTPTEAVALCRLVKACCPQQQVDEFTPNAWHGLLEDLRQEDCLTAVKALGRRQPFIAPAEIRDEVRRIRNDRLERVDPRNLIPPAELSDLVQIEWLKDRRAEIADDRPLTDGYGHELKLRDMRVIEGTFKRPEAS